MTLSPRLILDQVLKKELDKPTAVRLLTSLIESSEDEISRIESIKILEEMSLDPKIFFKLLENLLISDSNVAIRTESCKILGDHFKNKALPLMEWCLNNECDYDCYIAIINTLKKLRSPESKELLINEINKILDSKYLVKDRTFTTKSFQKDFIKLFEQKKIQEFSHSELVELLINYRTVLILKEKFYTVYHELDNGLVVTLDMTDIEYEVRGWKAEFKNNVKQLSDITGIKYLTHLSCLYLANNQITDLKDLIFLKKLKKLYLSNNLISDLKNIEYLKELPNLEYVDLSDNDIAEKIASIANDLPFHLKSQKRYY